MLRPVRGLLGLEKNPGSVGIRKKLKVEALKEVSKEAPVSFQPKKALAKLCGKTLHGLMCMLVEEAEQELQKLTTP